MNSLERMLSLLEVFTTAAPVWSTEALISYSGCTRSTCYRYIKALQTAGLLTPVTGGFVLGPRVVEMDRQIRTCDPIYNAGGPPMERLSKEAGHAALLSLRFPNLGPEPRLLCGAEDLPDPIGGDDNVYRACAAAITAHLDRLIADWTSP